MHRGKNRLHGLKIGSRSVARPVQIDQMQAGRPVADPPPGHFGRVVAIEGFPMVITLPQPHALAAAKINSGPNLHSLIHSRLLHHLRPMKTTRTGNTPQPKGQSNGRASAYRAAKFFRIFSPSVWLFSG